MQYKYIVTVVINFMHYHVMRRPAIRTRAQLEGIHNISYLIAIAQVQNIKHNLMTANSKAYVFFLQKRM